MQPTPRNIAPLLVALFFFGVGYLLFLENNASQLVYVDENALLVGMASTEMGGAEVQQLQSTEARLGSLGNKTRDFVRSQLLTLGMDVSQYTPFSDSPLTITHGVLRAQKGDGKQALLLVVSYYENISAPVDVPSGLSIGIVLMKHLSTTTWRSKDIVFVAVPISDHQNRWKSFEAFEMWVHTYHGDGDRSFARAGNIIGALTLDIPRGIPFSALSIVPGGHFGLLPNLDVISVVTRVFAGNSVPITVCETASTPKRLLERAPPLPPLRGDIKGFLRCFLAQLGGFETGFHGALLNYNVDAVTLRAVVGDERVSRNRWNMQNAMNIMRSVEACFRSFNNLIEKLHHSTFLYILISPNVFTIMEKCIPGCAAMGAPLLLYGASLIFFAGPSRFLHSFAVLTALYALSFSAFLLPHFLSWSLLTACLVVEALLVIFVYLPYINAMFPPSFKSEPVPSKVPLQGYVDDTWVNYASFKALAMMTIILSLSPLGIIDFPLASTVFLVIVPLLVPMVPFPFPKSNESNRKTNLVLYFLSRFGGLLALVAFSPPVLLLVISTLFDIQPSTLLSPDFILFDGRNLTLPTVFLTYLPAYLSALVLYTLYWVSPKAKAD